MLYTWVSQAFFLMAPFKEIKKAMAPSYKITKKQEQPLKTPKAFLFFALYLQIQICR